MKSSLLPFPMRLPPQEMSWGHPHNFEGPQFCTETQEFCPPLSFPQFFSWFYILSYHQSSLELKLPWNSSTTLCFKWSSSTIYHEIPSLVSTMLSFQREAHLGGLLSTPLCIHHLTWISLNFLVVPKTLTLQLSAWSSLSSFCNSSLVIHMHIVQSPDFASTLSLHVSVYYQVNSSLRFFHTSMSSVNSFHHLCTLPLVLCKYLYPQLAASTTSASMLFPHHSPVKGFWCGSLCLKYYRAPRYRVRCMTIVLVERRCTSCKNKWSSLLENNVY